MNNKIDFDLLNNKLTQALLECFEDMTIDELKKLDWLTLETDFFISKDQTKAA